MGILDAVKGLFESDVVHGALESTGLGDQLGALGEQVPVLELPSTDVAEAADLAGVDIGQAAELVPADVPVGDVTDVSEGIAGLRDPPT